MPMIELYLIKSSRDKGQANININNGMEIEQRGSETDARLTGVLSNSADTEHTEHDLDETRHRSDSVTVSFMECLSCISSRYVY